MGSGIATALILGNYPVVLKEVNEKFLQAGIDRIEGEARVLCFDCILCLNSSYSLFLSFYGF